VLYSYCINIYICRQNRVLDIRERFEDLLTIVLIFKKGGEFMNYTKPKILAQSTVLMADCRPNSKPSGRPCNPPRPRGGK
jgi:hypothetical protein